MDEDQECDIVLMDAGTDSIKLIHLGFKDAEPLKIDNVLARKRHNRKVQSKTKLGKEVYDWKRKSFFKKKAKNEKEEEKNEEKEEKNEEKEEKKDKDILKLDENESDEEIELIYPHIRHPLNLKKNSMYVRNHLTHDLMLLWNFSLQALTKKYSVQRKEIINDSFFLSKPNFHKKNCDKNLCNNNINTTTNCISKILMKEEEVKEKDYKICFVKPPPFLCSKNFESEIFSWIFEKNKNFKFATILHDFQAAVRAFDLNTACVVDVGNMYTRSVCVLESKVDSYTYKHVPIALHAVLSYLEKILRCRYPNQYVDRLKLKEIQKNSTFVSTSFQKDLWINSRCRGLYTHTLSDDVIIDLGADAFLCNEVLFNPGLVLSDYEHSNLSSIIVESIQASSIDYRRELLRNIILTGGITNTCNFSERLKKEIEHAWQSSATYANTIIDIKQNSDAIIIGAAKYALEKQYDESAWLSIQEYEESGCDRFICKTI